ncbi:MAG TPA: 16S rRNA (cytosine(1402)-N(4))-methyltransferase, partial [Phycisphaeraceae bacterium]
MEQNEHGHIAVMPAQVLAMLSPKPGEAVLDCTIGRGGHAAELIPLLGPGGRYVGLDLDEDNVAYARQRLTPLAQVAGVELSVEHANFQDARAVLDGLGVGRVEGLVADLGFASTQVEDPARGLSFTQSGPLDMRLNPQQALTAAELVNTLPERELADLIYQYGQEPLSRRIAR